MAILKAKGIFGSKRELTAYAGTGGAAGLVYISIKDDSDNANTKFININVDRTELFRAIGAQEIPVTPAAIDNETSSEAKDHTAYTGDQYKINYSPKAPETPYWKTLVTHRTMEAARGAAKALKQLGYDVQIWDLFDNREVAL